MKYVAYYRVSTQKQGQSGLGLEAQKAGIHAFCGDQLIDDFVEIESGGKSSRKELARAIELCKKQDAKLIAFRLDRILRSLDILVTLRQHKVKFTALDCLNDSDMIINIKAAFAEEELRKVSERTRTALAQKKAQGFQLGKPQNLTKSAQLMGVEVGKENARKHPANIQASELIRLYHRDCMSTRAIANCLNEHGFRTRRGKLFRSESVRRHILRLQNNPKR